MRAPINLLTSQIVRIDPQWIGVGGGVRYRADKPDSWPGDWGPRLDVTLLFLK